MSKQDKCPRCGGKLYQHEAGVHQCHGCDGEWSDEGLRLVQLSDELERIKAACAEYVGLLKEALHTIIPLASEGGRAATYRWATEQEERLLREPNPGQAILDKLAHQQAIIDRWPAVLERLMDLAEKVNSNNVVRISDAMVRVIEAAKEGPR